MVELAANTLGHWEMEVGLEAPFFVPKNVQWQHWHISWGLFFSHFNRTFSWAYNARSAVPNKVMLTLVACIHG
jgi:hypothetical protein